MSLLPPLFTFSLTVAALIVLSRWINRQVLTLGMRVTGAEQVAMVIYYLVMLPGILLHELSHAGMARLVGLKVGKFALGPRRRARSKVIELGSVTVGSGGSLRDSLVGLAPFLTGTAVLLLVGYQVFDVAAVGQAWAAGGWASVWREVNGIWRVPDFWWWAYMIFVVSNAMTPSPADRQPWLVAGLYIGLALVVVYVLAGLPVLPAALTSQAAGAFQVLTLGFLFTLALDLLAAAALWLVEVIILGLQGSRGLG
ncbi:MAG: hypothetical protein FJ011_01990 [Chloroflexi bacterium]|nr:hypothetical protein [Chloroflexota bacterium]